MVADTVMSRIPKLLFPSPRDRITDDDIEPYADDSEIRLRATASVVEPVLGCFTAATDIGLTMHPHPSKKGPQFLVGSRDVVVEGTCHRRRQWACSSWATSRSL